MGISASEAEADEANMSVYWRLSSYLYLINSPVYARPAGAVPSHGGPCLLSTSWNTQVVVEWSNVGVQALEVEVWWNTSMLKRK